MAVEIIDGLFLVWLVDSTDWLFKIYRFIGFLRILNSTRLNRLFILFAMK
jgi:hypothetical protein